MATYTKETALYDTGAISAGISGAGETASKYITAIDQNGIKVHAESATSTNYSKIDAHGLEVFVDGTSKAAFLDEGSRIGAADSGRVVTTTDGIEVYDSEKQVFTVDSSGAEMAMTALTVRTPPISSTSTQTNYGTRSLTWDTSITSYVIQIVVTIRSDNKFVEYRPAAGRRTIGSSTGSDSTATVLTISSVGGQSVTIKHSIKYTKVNSTRGSVELIRTHSGTTANYARTHIEIYKNYTGSAPCLTYGTRNANASIGGFSSALGYELIASDAYQTAAGCFNATPEENDRFIIGAGTSDSDRKNVFVVDKYGNTNIEGACNIDDDCNIDSSCNVSGNLVVGHYVSGSGIQGNITAVGNITVAEHDSPIGTYNVVANTASISSGTSFVDSGAEFTLSAGRYLIEAYAGFAGNSTGFRGIRITGSDDSSATDFATMSSHIQPALSNSGWTNRLHTSGILITEISSGNPVKVQVLQNSGSTLSVTVQARWIRIR